jgi:hypothetical protein
MRTSFVAFLLAALACLSGQYARVAEPAVAQVALERSEDLESALQPLGFEEVRVLSWHGGLLNGKVYFQDGENIKPVDFNTLANSVKELFPKGTAFDPSAISGVLVIAIKKAAEDAATERQCQVSIVVRVKVVHDDGKGRKKTESRSITSVAKGPVPAKATSNKLESNAFFVIGGGGTDRRARESYIANGSKKFTLYELDVSAK